MFSMFRPKRKPFEDEAFALYNSAMKASRNPYLYKTCGVEDSLEGRFEMICLHVVLIIHRLNEDYERTAELSQSLFDAMFADMDQSLRQIGIGDMGIPRRMKHMMKSFNGRIHVYTEALEARSRKKLEEAIKRNIFNSLKKNSDKLVEYVMRQKKHRKKADIDQLIDGEVSFHG